MNESAGLGSQAAAISGCGRLEYRDGCAWLWLDEPERKVNTLSNRVLTGFEAVVAALEAHPPEHGLVMISAKPETFVAGADLEEIQAATDPSEVRALVMAGHALLGRFQALPFPSVAAIHGSCLGGGLELALACDARVATEAPATVLGLPEVRLGLIPGLGGTQRLPRLIGVTAALPMILAGKRLDARRALDVGLVDAACPPSRLAQAAVELLIERAGTQRNLQAAGRKGKGSTAELVSRVPGGKKLLFDRARKEATEETRGHYPAPLAAVDVMERGLGLPLDEALVVEAEAFSRLAVSRAAKALISIFFLKNAAEARAASLARAASAISRVGVLGAGFMGAGVAQALSHRGFSVVLKDRELDAVGRGLGHCHQLFEGQVQRKRYRPVEATEAMARIHGTVEYPPLARCELVIEAVFEELALKQKVLRELEAVAREDQIFASNTSTLPITGIAEASRRPHNVVGMHFFSPVHKMPLVEVIAHPGSSRRAVASAVAVAGRMGKTAIVVADGPGFFTTRVLGPYLNEAAWCLIQGATIEEVDGALTRWGWPVGPFALMDEVGLDIAAHSSAVMEAELGARFSPPPIFKELREAGHLGRKSGRGFYEYPKSGGAQGGRGTKKANRKVYKRIGWKPAPIPEQEIAERCWMQMLNEAARTLEEGVIETPADVDLSVVLGFGFPLFRGGLLREADRLGVGYVVERLETLAEVYGERLRPAELLRRMAKQGESFYP